MKKLLFAALLMLFALAGYSQNDVTKFLGIPVDGSKQDMIRKLEQKGFKYDKVNDCLEGEFNGNNSFVLIGTTKNKVSRIIVTNTGYITEAQAKNRFNRLVRQFSRSDKYVALFDQDYIIPDDENISREILINKKSYEAIFFQLPDTNHKKIVWIKLTEDGYNKYSISIYYDNEYNRNTDDDI